MICFPLGILMRLFSLLSLISVARKNFNYILGIFASILLAYRKVTFQMMTCDPPCLLLSILFLFEMRPELDLPCLFLKQSRLASNFLIDLVR